MSPVAGAVGCCGFLSALAAPEDAPPVEEPEPIDEEPLPVVEPAPAAEELSLFGCSLEVLAEPDAAEPSDFFELFAELPPAAEPLTPRADRVSWSIWPEAFRPFEVWNSFRPFCVFGPITPSTWPTSWPASFSLVCTCLIVSAFWPPAMPPPAAALLFALPPEDAPAAAEPEFLSLDMLPLAELPPEVLPLAAGALELDDLSVEVDALPDVLLPELALESAGFCSVVVLLDALPLADGVDVDGVDALPEVLPDALPLADGVDVDGVDALPEVL